MNMYLLQYFASGDHGLDANAETPAWVHYRVSAESEEKVMELGLSQKVREEVLKEFIKKGRYLSIEKLRPKSAVLLHPSNTESDFTTRQQSA